MITLYPEISLYLMCKLSLIFLDILLYDKSTFLKCLCGIYKTKKDKFLLNNNRWKRKDRTRNCYMVYQDVNHQLFTESVLDDLIIGMAEYITLKETAILLFSVL